MKRLPLLCSGLLLIMGLELTAQAQPFTTVPLASAPPGVRDITPERARTLRADTLVLRELLFGAPIETSLPVAQSTALLRLPAPDGELVTFQLLRYPMLEPGLVEKFPGIVNLYGQEVGKGQRRIRLDWTYRGFHAVVRGGDSGAWYVDPLYAADRLHYQVYYRNELPAPTQRPECGVQDTGLDPFADADAAAPKLGDCTFRSYQLAVATTGEYYANQGNTDNAVLSTINTTISRVNEVTEIDLAVRFVLVANNNLLLFDNAGTDPYNDGSASQAISVNTGTIDGLIGSANYDIGHVFSWNGSGLAQLRSVCNNGSKGAGTTRRNGLSGDAFYIDYVAHEIGHQMGGPHTFNALSSGNCTSGNRSAGNAFEPGSGSTIMAYAGICSASNVQLNSDAYYHAGSIADIANFLELGAGATCPDTIFIANTAPTVSAGADYTIPANTPFALTATGSDADGDPLRYNWEQYNNNGTGYSGPPTGAETNGPLFRSLEATASPTRYFPNLPDLAAGVSPTWEVLPTVARTMTFRVTARDGAASFGCAVQDQAIVTVVASAGFAVTQPSGGENWPVGSTQTVTWEVAGTGAGSAVNCANVDILLSTDGGLSFPTMLASSVPNDGSQTITLPDAVGMDNRIMVRAVNNIFLATSTSGFMVSAQTFLPSAEATDLVFCANESVAIPFSVESLANYAGSVNLSVSSGLPNGATASFSANPVVLTAGEKEAVTLSLGNVPAGDHTIEVTATDGADLRTLTFSVTKKSGVQPVTLLAPAANTALDPTNALFEWTTDPEATQYAWFLYDDPPGSSLEGFATSNSQLSLNLSAYGDGTYYWQVGLRDGACDGSFKSYTPIQAIQFSRTQLSTPDAIQDICAGAVATQDYDIDLAAGATLTGNITFSTAGLPGGVSASFSPPSLSNSGSTVLRLSGLTGLAAGDYTFQAIATDADGSEQLELRLSVTAAPAAVAAVFPPDGSTQSDRMITFQWSADPGAELYDFEVGFNSDLSGANLYPNQPSNSIGVFTFQASDGVTAYWRATSKGSCGSDVASPIFAFTFGAALPVTWLDFRASATGTSVQLDWQVEEVSDNAGFSVQRSADGRQFDSIDWVPASGREGTVAYAYIDRTAVPGRSYYYRLEQRDRDGERSFSPVRQVQTSGTKLSLQLVPNPAYQSVTLITESDPKNSRYELSDAFGRVVQQGPVTQDRQRIDISGLPTGLYYLRFSANAESVVRRLVKQ